VIFLRNIHPKRAAYVPVAPGWARLLLPAVTAAVPAGVLALAGVQRALDCQHLAVVTEVNRAGGARKRCVVTWPPRSPKRNAGSSPPCSLRKPASTARPKRPSAATRDASDPRTANAVTTSGRRNGSSGSRRAGGRAPPEQRSRPSWARRRTPSAPWPDAWGWQDAAGCAAIRFGNALSISAWRRGAYGGEACCRPPRAAAGVCRSSVTGRTPGTSGSARHRPLPMPSRPD
jgi:hypothetical protein